MIFIRFRALFFAASFLAALFGSAPSRAQSTETASPVAGGEKPLTVEEIYAHSPLIGDEPQGLAWSPDGAHMTYLSDGELVDLDPATGKPHILVSRAKLSSLSNNSTTEKDRDHRDRYGMASYLWAPDSSHLLFDSNGSLWLYDLKTGTGLNIGSSGAASGDDPKFSPDGKMLSFLKNHSICIVQLREQDRVSCSKSNSNNPAILNGEVDWVYEEELDVRSNYFWSPNSSKIAYLEMDESNVPEYPIADWIPIHATVDKQRYPQPGDPNPAVRVGVAALGSGKTVWVSLQGTDSGAASFKPGEDYIPRFGWVDAKTIWVETLTRDHKHLNLYFAEASNGKAHLVLAQSDDKFFNEKYDISIAGGRIVITSWADGHTHIYLYSYDANHPLEAKAKLERQLTSGDFDVDEVLAVDERRKSVYYTSNEGNRLEEQLWQVSFDAVRKALTTAPGVHSGIFAPDNELFVDRYSNRMTPPVLSLCRGFEHDTSCRPFWSAHALDGYRLRAPEPLEMKAENGEAIYATLLLPEGKTEPASVPLILNPYGGPGPMTVQNRWGGDNFVFDELLAQHGFAVLHADNRGSGHRGREFEQAAYHNFGPVQLEDQLAVADAALAKYPQLDPKRQGWWGWSWGGSFTLYALSHSDRFRAGVAVAPVTDWRNYDSIYTERYMSEPTEFASGYKDFSVVNTAAKIHGQLLLVQGTGDDNVHFENMVQYIQQLTVNDVPYDLQIYPRKTHSIAGTEVRPYLFNRILQQFESYLMPPVTGGVKQ